MTAWPAAIFLSAAAACGLLTWLWIRFARSRQIQDHPGQRRLHEFPTPRGGGIAIALVLLAVIAWVARGQAGSVELIGLALGVGLFSLLGLLDDLLPVSAVVKFILQLIAATVLILFATQDWSLHWLALTFLVVACCYLVNVWNFMDGSNGLIAVQALMIALALAFWPGQSLPLRIVALALAGACTGFLPFNLPAARVFLGDVGSHALGAAVFGLLLLAWHEGIISWIQSLLMASVVLLDSGYTLLRRGLAGRPVWRAHRDHLYQYAVRRGHSHLKVCIFYGACTALTILLALSVNQFRSSIVPASLLIVVWLLGTLAYFGLRHHWLQPSTHRGREA